MTSYKVNALVSSHQDQVSEQAMTWPGPYPAKQNTGELNTLPKRADLTWEG